MGEKSFERFELDRHPRQELKSTIEAHKKELKIHKNLYEMQWLPNLVNISVKNKSSYI